MQALLRLLQNNQTIIKIKCFFLIFTPRNGKFADLLRHREERLAKKLSCLNSNLGLP